MSKSAATIDQKRKASLLSSTRSPGSLYQRERSAYVQAATKEMANGGIEGLVIGLFGPEFTGSLALALDPIAGFKFSTEFVTEDNRYRPLVSMGDTSQRFYKPFVRTLEWRDYLFDEDTKVDRFLYSSQDFVDPAIILQDDYMESSFCSDTTTRTRNIGSNLGEMELSVYTVDSNRVPAFTSVIDTHRLTDPSKGYNTWTRDEFVYEPVGSPFYSNGKPLSDSGSMLGFSYDFLQSRLYELLPRTLSSKRLFNTFYQLTELKDLPETIRNTIKLRSDIRELCQLGKSMDVRKASKILGNQYLNYQFGVASIYQAATGLLSLPAKATKRLNYLIGRNGKATTGRTKLHLEGDIPTPMSSTPDFVYDGPDWLGLLSWSARNTFEVELRMMVDQTITFPTLAVPSLRDKNYRDLLGLNPTIGDLYNLIPWSWLIDYFVGLGDYIDCMDAINSDTQLVNYGMYSFISDEVTTIDYVLNAQNSRITMDVDDNVLFEEFYDTQFAGSSSYKRHYHVRRDISRFDGAKVFGNNSGNLSDFQYSILGALLSKFV